MDHAIEAPLQRRTLRQHARLETTELGKPQSLLATAQHSASSGASVSPVGVSLGCADVGPWHDADSR